MQLGYVHVQTDGDRVSGYHMTMAALFNKKNKRLTYELSPLFARKFPENIDVLVCINVLTLGFISTGFLHYRRCVCICAFILRKDVFVFVLLFCESL